jgi:hypothetical protein
MFAQSKRAIFIPANVEWKDSPVTEGLQVAEDAEVFVFDGDHRYSYVSGVFHKDKRTGVISLCSGCGFSTQKGSWRVSTNSQLLLRFRLAHSGIKTTGERKWTVEHWSLDKASSPMSAKKINTLKGTIVSFTGLNNPSVLAGMLRDDD